MSGERKFKASHFENIQELIASCIIWIKTDDYDAYCRFFDMGAMEELIKELNNLKEIEKSHKEENGKLRVELEQEKEKNKEYEKQLDLDYVDKNYISKEKIRKKLEHQNMLWNTPNRQKEYNQEFAEFLEELLLEEK